MNRKFTILVMITTIVLLIFIIGGLATSEVTYDLTMQVSPIGKGNTTTPAVGTYNYTEKEVVDIIATPASTYQFVDWTGDVVDPNSVSTAVTMDASKTVTANFELIPWVHYKTPVILDYIPGLFPEECIYEEINFSGTLHYKRHVVFDSAGGMHFTGFKRHHLVGIGTVSGTKYIANFTNNWQGDEWELPFESYNDMATNLIISQGKETNLIMQWRQHITINANGELTAYFSEVKIKCTGE